MGYGYMGMGMDCRLWDMEYSYCWYIGIGYRLWTTAIQGWVWVIDYGI